MNTPRTKKPKRFDPTPITHPKNTIAHAKFGLSNPEYALRLAMIVTEFEHLEDHMAQVLAVLMDANQSVAGYVLRSIRAPTARFEVMRDLLQMAQWNAKLGPEWDEIIDEYWSIGRARNRYVHGRWFTEVSEAKAVEFSAVDDHGFAMLTAGPIKLKELDRVVERIRVLTLRLFKTSAANRLQRLGLEVPPHLMPPAATPSARSKAPPKGPPRRILKAQRKKLIRAALKKKGS